MQREKIVQICDNEVLDIGTARFGTFKDALKKIPEYEGAANLVYEYELDKRPLILRISFKPERPLEQIQAELHFINYLSLNGVNVSKPVPSQNGNLIETIQTRGVPFHLVTFARGRGMRVPDNNYRYREDVPIEEYFRNWGRILGQMHALSKNYQPESDLVKRPEWFVLQKSRLAITSALPDRLACVRSKIQSTLEELKALPKDKDSYGLIHGDFNDGNFTVDYSNGDITVFDFDDSCYFWFMYELASAWEGGIGRTMFRGSSERKSFMDHYMDVVMEGYNSENSISAEWFERLPLFIKLIQIEEFLHYVQYLDDPDAEMQGRLNYLIKCIENDMPYMGFFDGIYSPDTPFSL